MQADIVIIGSGPAGLQASIYASRRKLNVITLGKLEDSILRTADKVENFCFIETISGKDMLITGKKQAESFGAKFLNQDAVSIKKIDNNEYEIMLESNKLIKTKAIIIATGVKWNNLNVPGEKQYLGKGVSYCVECDAPFFKNKNVTVTGNGSAAISGAMFLLNYANQVTLITKSINVSDELKLQLKNSKVNVKDNSEIIEIIGDGDVLTSYKDKQGNIIDTNGIFVELGAKSALELFLHLGIDLDQKTMKYIKTDKIQQTNIQGIFAAGDVCGPPLQISKAIGQGCVSGVGASDYVNFI